MTTNPVTLILIGLVVLAIAVSVVFPIVGYRRWQRKGIFIGCLLQPIVAILVFAASSLLIWNVFNDADYWGTMVSVCYVEDDSCYQEEIWHYKTDGELVYDYNKHFPNDKTPCHNDQFTATEQTFERIDNTTSIRSHFNGEIIVTFDLDARTVTARLYDRPIEVVNIDWNKVEKYFKQSE